MEISPAKSLLFLFGDDFQPFLGLGPLHALSGIDLVQGLIVVHDRLKYRFKLSECTSCIIRATSYDAPRFVDIKRNFDILIE